MISIIIPTFNDIDKLKVSLVSINNQTVKDAEIIIVDDCSDKVVRDELLGFEFTFPTEIYRLDKNSGSQVARNHGFERSNGDYVIFWDADVIGRLDMLETMLNELKIRPEASYAYSSYWWGRKRFEQWEFDEEKLKHMNYIHTTSLIRREHFPGFDPAIKRFQDWDLWLTMLNQGRVGAFIPLYLFRVQTGGTMSSWLPKHAYRKPFKYVLPKRMRNAVKNYEHAVEVIKKKHNL